MEWLASVVRVSVSFQSFDLRMFVCPVIVLPSRLPSRARKVIFLSRLSGHVLERPHNSNIVRHCMFSMDPQLELLLNGMVSGAKSPVPIRSGALISASFRQCRKCC